MGSKPETMLLAAGKMVLMIQKIFSFAKAMVSGIRTRVFFANTIIRIPETTVSAAKNMVSNRADHGLQGFFHRIFGLQTELRHPKLVSFLSSSPLTSN